MSDRIALFPASFDPITNGHIDVARRALTLFDRLILAVARNVSKDGTFSLDDRLEMLQAVFGDEPRIAIAAFDGLTVDFAREAGARAIIRGVRAVSDFEYEFEMALMNKHLYPDIETLFMMTSQEFFYVSSSRLKELVRFGADIEAWVPPLVAKNLRQKLQQR